MPVARPGRVAAAPARRIAPIRAPVQPRRPIVTPPRRPAMARVAKAPARPVRPAMAARRPVRIAPVRKVPAARGAPRIAHARKLGHKPAARPARPIARRNFGRR
jgi:hypothetical protein